MRLFRAACVMAVILLVFTAVLMPSLTLFLWVGVTVLRALGVSI